MVTCNKALILKRKVYLVMLPDYVEEAASYESTATLLASDVEKSPCVFSLSTTLYMSISSNNKHLYDLVSLR